MYLRTVVTNNTDKDHTIPCLGGSKMKIGAQGSVTLPYDLLTAVAMPARKRSLLSTLETNMLTLSYETDVDVNVPASKRAKPAPVAPKVEPKVETDVIAQEDILSEKAKDALIKADETSGIMEDIPLDDMFPKKEILGEPIAEIKTVNLDEMLEGKEQPAEETKADVAKAIVKSAPKATKKKASAKKKAPAKKRVVKMT